MVVPLILTAAIAGGAGGGIANIALSPANSGASLLNSYWYGAGLILGERDMYTFHWEKIKKRLENGEDYLSVLESEMNPAITAISAYSLQIMQKTGELYKQAGVNFLTDLLKDLLNPFFSGDRDPDTDLVNDQGLFDYSAATIAGWSDSFLEKNFVSATSTPELFTPTTVQRIFFEHNKRQQAEVVAPVENPEPPPDIDTSCPSGFVWDPVTLKCIPIIVPSTIPLMTEANVKLHARGRMSRVIAPGGFFTQQWLLQTNPQRNGSYQTKDTANSDDDAQSWLQANFPQSTHGQWNFKTAFVGEERYRVLLTDVTVKNFP